MDRKKTHTDTTKHAHSRTCSFHSFLKAVTAEEHRLYLEEEKEEEDKMEDEEVLVLYYNL